MTALRLPALVYGERGDVERRAKTAVRRVREGAPWAQALDADDLIDVNDRPGLVVLDGPSPLLDGEHHFHIYVPWSAALAAIDGGRLSPEADDAVFEQSLAQAWGVLGLLARGSLGWVLDPGRARPLVEAAVGRWPALDSIGERYTNGSREPATLSAVPTTLPYALGQLGVGDEALRGQPSSAELMRLARAALAG